MPAAREGFAEEATFKLAIEALVGVRGRERGKMVQGEDIACARARRREIASWMWEMMSACLIGGGWQVAEMGRRERARDHEPLELCPLSPAVG